MDGNEEKYEKEIYYCDNRNDNDTYRMREYPVGG